MRHYLSRPRQRGLSLVAMLFLLALFGFFGLLAAKSIPAWNEYFAIRRDVNKIISNGETNPVVIRGDFDRLGSIDDVESISGKDLDIQVSGDKASISFDYDRSIHVLGNAWLVYHFSNSGTSNGVDDGGGNDSG